MLSEILAGFTGLPTSEVERLMSMTGAKVYDDPVYQELLTHLNKDRLYETLPLARDAYRDGLPAFKDNLMQQFHYGTEPVTPFLLANWLLGFLQYPDELVGLLKRHTRIPLEIVQAGLPDILRMLDVMPEGRAEWQQAAATLALPLVAMPEPVA